MDIDEYQTFIEDVDDNIVLYLDSIDYNSKEWRPWKFLSVSTPCKRMLTERECVMDLDDVTDIQLTAIIEMFKSFDLKFTVFKSSVNGAHIHFWTDVRGKDKKRALVKIMSEPIFEHFNVRNDLQPMNQENIRSEWSIHPKKGTKMEMIYNNINPIDPINVIPPEVKQGIGENYDDKPQKGLTGSQNDKTPKCIKFMQSNTFSDGRARIIFVLISWYKGSGKSNEEIYGLIKKWCETQNYRIYRGKVFAMINSNTGTVGCRYRHDLLEELGFTTSCDNKLH